MGVVDRYGWIDIPRFARPAAAAAILILKHGEDVPLMEAALPIVEHDAVANGGGKELVSILVDEVLITTGHKQKYGTQLTEDAQGNGETEGIQGNPGPANGPPDQTWPIQRLLGLGRLGLF